MTHADYDERAAEIEATRAAQESRDIAYALRPQRGYRGRLARDAALLDMPATCGRTVRDIAATIGRGTYDPGKEI